MPQDKIYSRYAQEGFQHINQGITIFDENLKLVYWNDRFLELLEFPNDLAHQGADFGSFIRHNAEAGEYGPGDVDAQVAERVAAAERFEKHLIERERPDGTVIEISGSPLPNGGFVTIYTDITVQKNRERELEKQAAERTKELAKSEARLQLIASEVPAGIAHVDQDMNILFANRKFARAYGLTPDEIVGKNCVEVLHPQTLAESKKYFEPARQGKIVDFEMRVQMPKDKVRDVRTFLRPERVPKGEFASFYIVSVDVTRNKAATSALLSSQKMDAVGRLSSGISHDFNNLLTIILGNLVPMEEQLSDDELRDEFLIPAISAARRGSSLTERLLNLAREKPINPKPVLADDSLTGLMELLRSSIPENIDIELDLNADRKSILVDLSELETAILNIVVNARDAIEGSGSIQITTESYELTDDESDVLRLPMGEYLKITVRDTGAGMSPIETEQVFEPFHTTKADAGGSGLGLAMVYSFVRQSNGAIWVDSAKGQGTTFSIILPTTQETPLASDTSNTVVHRIEAEKKPLVLLVEDDEEVRRVVRRQLTDIGYSTLEAENAESALDLLEVVEDLTAVVSDVIMPGKHDGTALANIVAEKYPDISVVLMSGNLDRADHLKKAPCDTPLLRKPFSNSDLAAALAGDLPPFLDDVQAASAKAVR